LIEKKFAPGEYNEKNNETIVKKRSSFFSDESTLHDAVKGLPNDEVKNEQSEASTPVSDKDIRVRVSEALTATAEYKKNMELYFQEHGEFPPKACNSCLDMGSDGDCGNAARQKRACNFGVNSIGKYIENIHIGGRIEPNVDQDLVVTLSRGPEMGDAAGKRIILRAFNNNGSTTWACYSANVDGIDQSKTIGVWLKHLPSACEGNTPCPLCK
jgi:hypothetical protein